ncbi:MAG: hypothetical protein Q9170_007825 [Blastenia crenularia]
MDIVMVPQHGVVPVDRWITIVLGILLFLFFGLGTDATKMYRKWLLKLRLSIDHPDLYGHVPLPHPQSPSTSINTGSLRTLFVDFCRKRLSSRQSSTSHSEKRHTATTITTLASPTEAEKTTSIQDFAFPSPTRSSNTSQPSTANSEAARLPTDSAAGRFAWIGKYIKRVRDQSPPDDIESALQRHENHRPNRFIAGLWHVNSTSNAARVPAAPGICAGNCNGLKL